MVTMNENRFIAPVVYEIARSVRNEEEFWDINRRDYLYYTLALTQGKILFYWFLSPVLLILVPFLGYFFVNVYTNLFWLLMLTHFIPDFELDVPSTVNLYKFNDWSSILMMRADDLCPDGLIAMPDGDCSCLDHQVQKGK